MGLLVLLAWAVLAGAVPDLSVARLGLDRAPPDLWVAMATFLALKGSGYHVVKWGILLGLLADCASLDPLGTHAFVLGTVTFLFARRHGDVRGVTGALVPLSIALATIVARVLYVVRCLPLHRDGPVLAPLLAAFPAALTTALVSWPLLVLLERAGALDDLTGRRRAARA